MFKPIPGKSYTVVTGDTLERIAKIAYGDASRAADIARSNQVVSLVPGLLLNLPPESVQSIQISSDGLVLVVAGLEVLTESLRFFESIETMVDAWTATIAWVPGAKIALDAAIKPYSYSLAFIYLDKQLLGTGRLYVTSPSLGDRQQCTLECYSLAADIVDSTLKPPFEENKVTLKQRAEALAAPFSIAIESQLNQDGVFDRVTVGDEQTAGAHLLELAKQRGVLVSSTAQGNLLLSVPEKTGVPVATIEEGFAGFTGFAASFNGRDRFSDYRVVSESPVDDAAFAVSVDDAVVVPRFTTKRVNDLSSGEIQTAADWEKNKFLVKALTLPIEIQGFKTPSGQRWQKGFYITFISPTLFIPDGLLMVIRSVEFVSDGSGDISRLTIAPAGVYAEGLF